ncbi:UNVERIFIED_ORG: hypothetical protein ABIB13_002262 [Arthrobacter sp. UYEF2]
MTGTGFVDTATDDYSIIWVWTDGGQGRRMFLQGMGAIVEPLEQPGDGDGQESVGELAPHEAASTDR